MAHEIIATKDSKNAVGLQGDDGRGIEDEGGGGGSKDLKVSWTLSKLQL